VRNEKAADMSSSSGSASPRRQNDVDPILRNALRFTISAREEALLRQYLSSRTSSVKNAPKEAAKRTAKISHEEDYNMATARIAARLFAASFSGLTIWDLISRRFFRSKTIE